MMSLFNIKRNYIRTHTNAQFRESVIRGALLHNIQYEKVSFLFLLVFVNVLVLLYSVESSDR